MVSKPGLPLRGTGGPWRAWSVQVWDKRYTGLARNIFSITKSRKLSKTTKVMSERTTLKSSQLAKDENI